MNLSTVFIDKNASDDNISASYNWAPMLRQQFWWKLRTLHSDELQCAFHKSSFRRSVFAICPCLQLYKYGCNVLQIWFFYLELLSQYLRTRSLQDCKVTFGSVLIRITKLSNSYRHIRFEIFQHLSARGDDLFQKRLCLSSWFGQPYFTNHLRYFVGFNECSLEAANCLESVQTCALVAIIFTLRNWGEWQLWHHMYGLSSSSLPSIRTWDQLNGVTLAGKSSHRKVKWICRVSCHWID